MLYGVRVITMRFVRSKRLMSDDELDEVSEGDNDEVCEVEEADE